MNSDAAAKRWEREQEVVTAAVIGALHALTSIVQDESADDAMRMACADMIFTYASSYYVGRDEDDDDKDKTEGKPDE